MSLIHNVRVSPRQLCMLSLFGSWGVLSGGACFRRDEESLLGSGHRVLYKVSVIGKAESPLGSGAPIRSETWFVWFVASLLGSSQAEVYRRGMLGSVGPLLGFVSMRVMAVVSLLGSILPELAGV